MPDQPPKQGQPRRSIFDHPEVPSMSDEGKIATIAKMLTMKDLHWDGEILVVPTNQANLSKMNRWIKACKQEGITLINITEKIDPQSAPPSRNYFVLE